MHASSLAPMIGAIHRQSPMQDTTKIISTRSHKWICGKQFYKRNKRPDPNIMITRTCNDVHTHIHPRKCSHSPLNMTCNCDTLSCSSKWEAWQQKTYAAPRVWLKIAHTLRCERVCRVHSTFKHDPTIVKYPSKHKTPLSFGNKTTDE